MVNLTAAQIKTILLTGTYSETIEINASLMQNDERRKYPSIDVQNVTGQDKIKDLPTTTTTQTFLVHLWYRYRSFGEQHEPDIKSLEDEIFTTIDTNSNFSTDTKISITQGWRRDSETFPVRRSHSVLTVTAEELSSTSGSGIVGDQVTITIPTVSGAIDVISVITDEAGIIKDLNLGTSSEQVYTRIRRNGILALQIAVSVANEDLIKTQIFNAVNISITFTKGGIADVRTVNMNSIVASGPRNEVETQIVTMDVLY